MYFLTSTDKIRPFLEKKAADILNESKENLSSAKKVNKQIFNKIGHALHALNPVFREVTFSDSVKDIAKSFQLKKPVVCQSMYIFKQPFIGGEGLSDSLF
jgi:phytanoyl-CoA hydroxylase